MISKRRLVILLLVIFLLILTLTECTTTKTTFKAAKVEIRCPKHPNTVVLIRVEELKHLNPDACPKEK